ncbi:hypothetical protein [Halomonas salipaludis]|uniref:hypothetical protein n=1 Tax=Halomonas salipaludis TaxID=2032625 RepID=UPI001140AFB6|nr:hypothetical protein [Halomonas salipaludis]
MKNNLSIHFKYTTGILSGVIILLLTRDLASIPRLQEYIAFALTFSSLLLALIAIVYSFLSNESLSISLNKINTSAEEISKLSSSIRESNETLHSRAGDVDKRVSESNLLIKEIGQNESNSRQSNVKQEISDTFILNYLKKSSLFGCEALFAAALSQETGKSIKITKLLASEDDMEVKKSYYMGYISASQSSGIFDYNGNVHNHFHISNATQVFIDNVEKKLLEKIDEAISDLSASLGNQSARNFAEEGYLSILKYFEVERSEKIQPTGEE